MTFFNRCFVATLSPCIVAIHDEAKSSAKGISLRKDIRQRSVIPFNQHTGMWDQASALIFFHGFWRDLEAVMSVNELNVYRAATLNYTIPHIRIGFGIDMSGHPIDETYVHGVTEQSIGSVNLRKCHS